MSMGTRMGAALLVAVLGGGPAAPAVPAGKQWSSRMADSVMKRTPDALMLDAIDKPRWEYTPGLVLKAILDVHEATGDERYWRYAISYYDAMIDAQGSIAGGYAKDDYNIDRINPGKPLFRLYARTREEKYRRAIEVLRQQMREHPRTSEGGFWHKKRYPHQMWLDGLYMGAPFLAQYAATFGEPALFDDVVRQFVLMEQHGRDGRTGLLHHGWDESRKQRWADPATGRSPSFWGRAMGWYAMGLVETLDFLPRDHRGRAELIAILDRLAAAVTRVQDPRTGLWYQVVDQGARPGNYLEASVSSMLSFALLKGARLGYLDAKYGQAGRRAYEGILRELVEVHADGTVDIHRVCQVAGLGGDPERGERYRDGTFEYYVGEKVRSNDPKAVGPFIFASLEMERREEARPAAAKVATRGGLAGRVVRVTSLEAGGPGSLREALDTRGPRLVVFDVGGVIDLGGRSLSVRQPHLTVAGQTAPDPGVTLIRGGLVVETHDVVLQHLAVRPGDGVRGGGRWEPDALGVRRGPEGVVHGVVFDHCSATWAVDENLSLSGPADATPAQGPDATARDVTLTRCLVAEALSRSTHGKGEHSKGTLVHDGVRGVAIKHSLYAHNRDRNPRLKGGTRAVFSGNLVYNWGSSCVGVGTRGNRRRLEPAEAVVAANVALAGPDTRAAVLVKAVDPGARVFLRDNLALDAAGAPLRAATPGVELLTRPPAWAEADAEESAWTSAERVLREAGMRPARRDPVDARIVRSVVEGTGRIIDSQEQVGGYPSRPPARRRLEVPDGEEDRRLWLRDLSAALAVDQTLDLRPLRRRLGRPEAHGPDAPWAGPGTRAR